ncbi:MAG: HEAT repeat domain-containing protein [Theionarchaea archaeon]|nr:HEAT repeat domain-containing protein [Theionarchaea archaeon]MBU7000930.1 HEAT repeat domain-containing protein [Theionarchaea archaeon]MBU7021129.1 HEAT repeat domain-containing protein [Theionarchaea archaeon]MBU7033855.1 HEAT repeat domain-containing protein [Theionarchaea archaeon]MBU7039877.1 HEAT repeat domain-containing protein [Theionarchaea archaeon]
MNELLEKLRGGDLRSDGRANEVVKDVLESRHLLPMVIQGLDEPDDVVRRRTADALEKISRIAPELLKEFMRKLTDLMVHDDVPMVRWHLVMICGNVELSHEEAQEVVSVLVHLLQDRSTFVRSWTVATLCILGLKHEGNRREITERIRTLTDDESIAVRSRVARALDVLEFKSDVPAGWRKGQKGSSYRMDKGV